MKELSPSEHVQILDLDARYVEAIDADDGEAFAACFAPQGTFVVPDRLELRGREDLAAFGSRSGPVRTFHQLTARRCWLTDNGASGRARVLVLQVPGDNSFRVHALGEYVDDFVIHEGQWCLVKRVFVSWLG